MVTVTVTNEADGTPVDFATCVLVSAAGVQKGTAVTDDYGHCTFERVPQGAYTLEVVQMGNRKSLKINVQKEGRQTVKVSVNFTTLTLGEVVITAKEGGAMTSTSAIGRDAISHIQPSSFADLLELLPGGQATDPNFASAQTIRLREADPVASYATSSLGTQFMVDGVPINNDANLQSSPVSSSYGSSFTSAGVDMRSVSTDNVESVEIVRGIPSVEYGDLTSGLVKIERRRGGGYVDARLKADMSSRLASVGKGFEWNGPRLGKLTLNLDLSWLDSHNDPRDTRQSYQRLTGSVRLRSVREMWGHYQMTLGASVDYTGSYDDEKSDADINQGVDDVTIETYKSTYKRTAVTLEAALRDKSNGFFRSLNLNLALTTETDRIDRWKLVELGMDTPVCTASAPGEWDATIVPYTYEATLAVEGKPLYAYANAVANFNYNADRNDFGLKVGANWSMSKNNGAGTVFDLERPFSVDMNVRPRVFSNIPAINQLHLFAENGTTLQVGNVTAKWMVGVRAMTMLNLDKAYSLHGSWKWDPRTNLRLQMPLFEVGGHNMSIALSGGWGRHTKFPTAEQLYPDMIWYDITQMNYWPSDPSQRRVNMAVFCTDPTNYSLNVARNTKMEASLDVTWRDCMLTVTAFREDMRSGFRTSNAPARYIYKNYGTSTTQWTPDTLLTTHAMTTNGSRTLKTGIEFTLISPRIKVIMTRFSVGGAYFRTRYTNSQPEYYRPSVSINGKAYPYLGYYADTDNYLRERFNTNFSTDTQLPRIGLVFSTSFQCTWFTGSQNAWRDPNPLEYVDKDLMRHLYTAESAADGVLGQLVRGYNTLAYVYTRVPFCMNINLKVSKKLYHDRITLALFANKLLDVSPSYVSPLGVKVRREVNPYFGMELNLRI